MGGGGPNVAWELLCCMGRQLLISGLFSNIVKNVCCIQCPTILYYFVHSDDCLKNSLMLTIVVLDVE